VVAARASGEFFDFENVGIELTSLEVFEIDAIVSVFDLIAKIAKNSRLED
jgi:hypothetical protein